MKRTDRVPPARRQDRYIKERVHDPYKTRLKLHEPSVCPQCGAVFHDGRWQWRRKPKGAEDALCQACHRINDDYPAGVLTLGGAFLRGHAAEIEHLVRHVEKLENGEHPLHRIMKITPGEGGEVVVTTTDIHLPRRIAEALYNAYEGEMDFHYDEEGYFVRASWSRS